MRSTLENDAWIFAQFTDDELLEIVCPPIPERRQRTASAGLLDRVAVALGKQTDPFATVLGSVADVALAKGGKGARRKGDPFAGLLR